MNNEINKLPQEVINQIAAGEVIERPASVVKELVDNSIDAGADKIEIFITDGGKKQIEIRDNGRGMSRENLKIAFEPHTTSKVRSIEELDSVISMGFRGEALSTIVSVSKVEAISNDGERGYLAKFEGITPESIEEHPSTKGTSIKVSDLFYNLPARAKYLRADDTEYRYIYSILVPYFIRYDSIHFVLNKNGKEVLNIPKETENYEGLSERRIRNVIKSDFTQDLIPLHFDGNGIKVGGFVAAPNYHLKKNQYRYIFINGRPIKDAGINRSVLEGFSSFIPKGESIPYILSLDLSDGMVDINVHPRKEEVKFLNPYRVYSAIEQATADALKKKYKGGGLVSNLDSRDEIAYSRLRGGDSKPERDHMGTSSPKVRKEREFIPKKDMIEHSLDFSQSILQDSKEEGVVNEEGIEDSDIVSINQVFNKYIIAELGEELWIIDQHAAAERITFEALKRYKKNENPQVQNYLLPKSILLEEGESEFFTRNLDYFKDIGFSMRIDESEVKIDAVPAEFANSDIEKMIREIADEDTFAMESDFEQIENQLLATMACHNSIRTNQKLHRSEMRSLVDQLLDCQNPYSCPHGRPIVWKLNLADIDSNFDRTY